MPATILDGTKIAQQIRSEVAAEVRAMAAGGVRPGLAVVLVGHNPASEIYVRGKVKACEEVGLYSEQLTPPESATTAELLAVIEGLNRRDDIDGILVQLPLPPQVDAKKVLLAVDPAKDVDGFHPMNVGFLSTQRPGLVPCTPAGCMEILKRSNIPIAGREAVVVGRSDIVGKPAAMLLLNANATVTVAGRHSGGGHWTRRDDYPGLRKTGRDGDRRGDEHGDRRGRIPALFCRQCEEGRGIPQEGINADRRRASGSRGSRRRAHTRARWCRAADHRHADVQYGESGKDAEAGVRE
jgi:5,10-methylene-tetrahydrofolate dehydrogenase/methenyl tetrahydrofolate cyclohydrolase